MTPERAKKLLPIITAIANGEEIQGRRSSNLPWVDLVEVEWRDHAEYRIKPKVPEYRLFRYANNKYVGFNGTFSMAIRNASEESSLSAAALRAYQGLVDRKEGMWITDWLPISNYHE